MSLFSLNHNLEVGKSSKKESFLEKYFSKKFFFENKKMSNWSVTSRLDKKVKKFLISRLSDFESTCSGFYAWFWWQVLFKLTRHVSGMGPVVLLRMTLNNEIVWIVTILDLPKCPKIRNITRNCMRRVHISGKDNF